MKRQNVLNVIRLDDRKPTKALERLNRLTGLNFTSYPESLINQSGINEKDDQELKSKFR